MLLVRVRFRLVCVTCVWLRLSYALRLRFEAGVRSGFVLVCVLKYGLLCFYALEAQLRTEPIGDPSVDTNVFLDFSIMPNLCKSISLVGACAGICEKDEEEEDEAA